MPYFEGQWQHTGTEGHTVYITQTIHFQTPEAMEIVSVIAHTKRVNDSPHRSLLKNLLSDATSRAFAVYIRRPVG
jgi:hypothetical protein